MLTFLDMVQQKQKTIISVFTAKIQSKPQEISQNNKYSRGNNKSTYNLYRDLWKTYTGRKGQITHNKAFD
jgi:hypothetical protein